AYYRGEVLPVEALDLTTLVRKKDLTLEKLRLRLGDSEIAGSGSLNNFSKPTLNFAIEPNLDLSQMTRFAGTAIETGGNIRGKAAVTGRLDDLQILGDIEGNGIAAAGYSQVAFKAKAQWNSKAEQVRVEAFSGRSVNGQVEGTGTIALNTS